MAANPVLSAHAASLVQRALACARTGDIAGARSAARKGLRGREGLEIFHALLGGLDCQAGDLTSGVAHFRAALALRPGDVAVRSNLVLTLLNSGDVAAALTACPPESSDADLSLRLPRLRAYLLQRSEAHAEAAAIYRRIVTADPQDYESWNNLGNSLGATGDGEGALAAIGKAAALQPRSAPVRLNHAATLAQFGRLPEAEQALLACCADFPRDEKPRVQLSDLLKMQGRDSEALDWLEAAAQLAPADAELQQQLGMDRQFALRMSAAESAFRKAIALRPDLDQAHVLLVLHLEHTNALDAMAEAIRAAQRSRLQPGTIHLLQALLYRREKRFAESVAELDLVPAGLESIRVAQLRGECHERLGNATVAFHWFTEMNRMQQQDRSEPLMRAHRFREVLASDRALVTPQWHARWHQHTSPVSRASPVFLLGFPRSGTTLLDTMLMGHPRVQVLEERPTITRVEREIGGMAALPGLSGADIERLRGIYFDEARRWMDLRDDSVLVDKFPLNLNKVPIIHRLFPDARFVLALRHPMDVLLSCYMTNFRLNNAMVNFLELDSAAWLYDQSFGFWEQSRRLFGVTSRTVVYERMVEDAAAELRPLFDFLGLEWLDNVLDHQRTASSREVITTASYAQVTEPIYQRARGRWERYRPWLEPVLPMMQPWIRHHGYQS